MSTADPALLQTAAEAVDPAGLRRILLNWAALLGAYVLPRGLTFASALVAARVLGPERFGAYGTAASYAIIVSIIATLIGVVGALIYLYRLLVVAREMKKQGVVVEKRRIDFKNARVWLLIACVIAYLLLAFFPG